MWSAWPGRAARPRWAPGSAPSGEGAELGDGDKAAVGSSPRVGLAVASGGALGGPGPAHRLRALPLPFVGGGCRGLWGRQPGLGTPALGSGPAQAGSARSSSHTGRTESRGKGGFGERAPSSRQPLGWAVGGTLAPWAGLSGGRLVPWGHPAQHLGAWGLPASRPLDTPLPPHRGAPAGTPCRLTPWPPVPLWPDGHREPPCSLQRGRRGRQQAPGASGCCVKAMNKQAHGVRVHLWVFPKLGASVSSVTRVVLSAGQGCPTWDLTP